jgi:predicted transcriptional regulator
MNSDGSLRLSVLRAFLDRIHPTMRLIKAKFVGDQIVVTVILSEEPTDRIREDVSEAATEIIADFPSANRISECLDVSRAPIPSEDIFAEGWVYKLAE